MSIFFDYMPQTESRMRSVTEPKEYFQKPPRKIERQITTIDFNIVKSGT